jgi:hypothetical protein
MKKYEGPMPNTQTPSLEDIDGLIARAAQGTCAPEVFLETLRQAHPENAADPAAAARLKTLRSSFLG